MRPTPDSICAWLDGLGIGYRRVVHAPTRTSEESARARGEPLEHGAKALVLRLDDRFGLFVMSAARKLRSGAVRQELGVKDVRFANPEELLAAVGLEPGSVPPFGRPVLPLDLHVDTSIPVLERVAFNAASLTESLIMARADYERAAGPARVFGFSVEGG